MLRSILAALTSLSLVVGGALANHPGSVWADSTQPNSQKSDDKKPDDKKPDDPKPDDKKPDDKKPDDKKPDDKKPEAPKPDDKKPEPSKPDDKKPEDKKPELPKPDDKKPEAPKPDDKKPEDKKPEDKKPEAPKPDDKKPEDKKPTDKPEEKKAEPTKAETPKAATKKTAKASNIKPFDDVITAEAKSSRGVFMVYKQEEKIYYEIPVETLGKDFLWVTQIEKTGAGSGYGGSPVGDRVVRWEQRNDDILLRDVNYDIRADTKDPIHNAVESSSVEPIIAVLPVRAYGKDKAPVIDVTELFTGDLPEFGVGRRLGGGGADPRKTFIEGVKAYPENIETKMLMTYRRGGGGLVVGPGGPQPNRASQPGGGSGSVTVLVHHSMIKLPEEPMKPRKFDDRVGFFTEAFQDYGDISNHQVEDVRYITRWRLEKKDPSAAISEPKKPIVFYVGREVPDKFRPAIKKGIESWQVAFEKAGFKNAILAKDAPTVREDPDWDAEDARYSTIRWLPATIENAMGPHVHDPRSGEILEADILVYHNILKLTRDWYFIQASPNDPKAQTLPLSDDLICDLLTYVIAHEVGHSLGFPHNMKASSSYSVAQLRDPKFTNEFGTEASIMDYGRFNYVAQPGDGARLIPMIGPYDKFAVEWGYKPFPEATNFEAEKAKLDEIVARQIKDATLRFGDPTGSDPSSQTEDLGSDAVAATELGLKNLDRVAAYLVKATSKKGEDYEDLRNMYQQLISQRNRELGHVVALIGGSVETNLYFGDADKRFDPVPADKQREAVAFLLKQGFQVPTALIDPAITDRLEADGAVARIGSAQASLLRQLVSDSRIRRMAEQTSREPRNSYSPRAFLNDLRDGIWAELKTEPVAIDLYRRNLQRAHLEMMTNEVNRDATNSDLPALARAELRALMAQVDAALKTSQVIETTRIYLDDVKARITQALEPKAMVQSAPAASPFRVIFGGDLEENPGNEPL